MAKKWTLVKFPTVLKFKQTFWFPCCVHNSPSNFVVPEVQETFVPMLCKRSFQWPDVFYLQIISTMFFEKVQQIFLQIFRNGFSNESHSVEGERNFTAPQKRRQRFWFLAEINTQIFFLNWSSQKSKTIPDFMLSKRSFAESQNAGTVFSIN